MKLPLTALLQTARLCSCPAVGGLSDNTDSMTGRNGHSRFLITTTVSLEFLLVSNALGRSDQRCFKLEWQVVRKSGCIALFSPSLCGDWHRRGARLPRRQLHQHRDDVECDSSFYFLTRLQLALASYCPCNEIATSMMAERSKKIVTGSSKLVVEGGARIPLGTQNHGIVTQGSKRSAFHHTATQPRDLQCCFAGVQNMPEKC